MKDLWKGQPTMICTYCGAIYACDFRAGIKQIAMCEECYQQALTGDDGQPDEAQEWPRSLLAKTLGAKVLQVAPGYLTVVQKRARDYAEARGAMLAPFGLDCALAGPTLAEAARSTGLAPDEVWCAAGSGVLARALRLAWPQADLHAVQIGKAVTEAGGATVHVHPLAFSDRCRTQPPFPSDAHYDAKAWETCKRLRCKGGAVVFWNVAGAVG